MMKGVSSNLLFLVSNFVFKQSNPFITTTGATGKSVVYMTNGCICICGFTGERDGEDRGGGPRGGGRGSRDRDGDGRDGGGQRKQHSGNAWSKGRPRISSSDGPPQMKKFEEPQVPVSVEF